MNASRATRTGAIVEVMIPWGCLTLAGAFFGLVLGSSAADLRDGPVTLVRYLDVLGSAALGAGVVTAVFIGFGAHRMLARLCCAAGLCYLAFLKAVGIALAPWLALGLAIVAAIAVFRRTVAISAELLLMHAMGTLAGIYLVLNLHKFLAGWDPFRDVLRALGWLMRG
jgi:hypothetical protein